MTVPGIQKILALTIMYETGPIERFEKVGNYASYCRCVGSKRFSNEKVKGKGNRRNGNKYLCWAYVEAAHHAQRHYECVKRYYQRKMAKTNLIVARKTIAHMLGLNHTVLLVICHIPGNFRDYDMSHTVYCFAYAMSHEVLVYSHTI